ncbi:PTS N-acetylgalactosamine transporter subunit IID, partial [Streptococcus pyogenes]
MTGSNKLSKKENLKTAQSTFFLQNGINSNNYQGIGYAN